MNGLKLVASHWRCINDSVMFASSTSPQQALQRTYSLLLLFQVLPHCDPSVWAADAWLTAMELAVGAVGGNVVSCSQLAPSL